MTDDLPEEFAPTGPKLSRFPIRPAPPIRPQLFADELRFARGLALLAGGSELAAWAWLSALLATAGPHRWPVAVAGAGLLLLRLARPLWARLGTRVPRTWLAFALLATALLIDGAALLALPLGRFPGGPALLAAVACGLPALGDLALSTAADAITVERRPAAFSAIEMGQSLGAVLGLAICASSPRLAPAVAGAGLVLAGLGVPDLRDRGTPRSSWPLPLYADALRTPLARTLCGLSAAPALLAALALPRATFSLAAPLLGMAFAARAEPRAPNAVALPRLLLGGALAAAILTLSASSAPRIVGVAAGLLGLIVLGALASVLPASVARGAGELERPIISSLVWSALFAGATLALAAAVLG